MPVGPGAPGAAVSGEQIAVRPTPVERVGVLHPEDPVGRAERARPLAGQGPGVERAVGAVLEHPLAGRPAGAAGGWLDGNDVSLGHGVERQGDAKTFGAVAVTHTR